MNINIHIFVGEGRKPNRTAKKGAVLFFLLLFYLFLSSARVLAQSSQDNVSTQVNVTNAGPEVLSFFMENPIVLSAGAERAVYCNATVRDYNGYNDIDIVNATFYYFQNQTSPDDKNVHYTTDNCTRLSDDGQFLANYSCLFNVSYIAYNGTWYCNLSVNDSRSYNGSGLKAVNISALYALNVTDIIDYGNLSVTDYSANITATITNFGNVNINVSVLGYGAIQGDGLGFVCTQGTNISVQYQRFSGLVSALWEDKIPLNSTNNDMNITLSRQTDDVIPVTADTYWQLYVPPNPFGLCTGTVRFTATAP